MEKKSIGSFIAALRKSYGLTQQEVADRLNVSNKTVSKWERDESYPEITLIPVIAELYNVTSDEILRGERVREAAIYAGTDAGTDNKNDNNTDYRTEIKTDIKADKQLKRLVGSSISKFKNISYIAFALCAVGLILLFTVSYAFYRPVLAFGIFLLFVITSIILELILMNYTSVNIKDNDIFEGRNEQQQLLQNTRYRYTFSVIIVNMAAIIFALPFILVRDSYYTNSVITMESYISLSPILAVIAWGIYKVSDWFMRRTLLPTENIREYNFPRKMMSNMNALQFSALAAQYLMVLLSDEGRTDQLGRQSSNLSPLAIFLPLLFILISLFAFIVRAKEAQARLILTLAGARNLLCGFAGLCLVFIINLSKRGFVELPGIFFIAVWSGFLLTILYEIFRNKMYGKGQN